MWAGFISGTEASSPMRRGPDGHPRQQNGILKQDALRNWRYAELEHPPQT
jgi:hypothetical protein